MAGVFNIGSERRKKLFGRYEISDQGVVYSDGFPLVAIHGVGVNIGGQRLKICDLVAKAFVPNPYKKPYIMHKNGDQKDNRACNLVWSDCPDVKKVGRPPVKRWCRASTVWGDVIGMWESVKQASYETNIDEESIRRALYRRQKQAGGYIWTWL